jgi:hypothetical protein
MGHEVVSDCSSQFTKLTDPKKKIEKYKRTALRRYTSHIPSDFDSDNACHPPLRYHSSDTRDRGSTPAASLHYLTVVGLPPRPSSISKMAASIPHSAPPSLPTNVVMPCCLSLGRTLSLLSSGWPTARVGRVSCGWGEGGRPRPAVQ